MSITFISAGAGSGKTTRLMELISEAIASGESPERIVATTFTIKAAEEIKSRIQQKFLNEGDFERANAASAVMVGTINSVCGRLLSLFAFEAGMSPQLGILDEEAAKLFMRKVIHSSIGDGVTAEFDRLERRFGPFKKNKSQWQDHVRHIIDAARSAHIDPDCFSSMAEKNANAMLSCIGVPLLDYDIAMADLLEDAIPAMEECQKPKVLKNTQEYLDVCVSLRQGLAHDNVTWGKWLKLEKNTAGKNCADWPDRVAELAASWKTHKRFHEDVRRYLELVFETAAAVMDAYSEQKKLAGMLDFTDQIVRLYELLEKPETQERLKERLGLLVVDEFQDTSPIQLALFVRLAELSGSTYWVGDVKQAIYGFRGSDSALMEGILDEFAKRGSKIDILPKSYRSRSSLVSLANSIFVPAFADELSEDRVVLEPVRDEIPGEAFIHWNLDGSNIGIQTDQLAGGIVSLLESDRQVFDKDLKKPRSICWKDIAVLARSGDDVTAITNALKAAGIPLRTSGTGLLATPEAHLVLASLRRLNDSHDTLASAEILGLTEGLSPDDWLAERLEWVKTHTGVATDLWRCTGEKANPVLFSLEKIRPLADQLGPRALLDAVIARCGFDRYIFSWQPQERQARERLANLESIRSMVREYEENGTNGTCTLAGLILWFGERAVKLDSFPDSPVDGVTVLTWHKAKGLEWPLVILHGSWKGFHDVAWNSIRVLKETGLDLNHPLAGSWIRFWPWPFGESKKLDSVDVSTDPDIAELMRRNVNEERRLLYVGVTRARDILVVAMTGKSPKPDAVFTSLGISQSLYAEPKQGETTIILADETSVSYACLTPEPAMPKTACAGGETIKWFDTDYRPVEYLPARLTPSDAPPPAGNSRRPDNQKIYHAGTILRHAVSMKRNSAEDIRAIGNLYHAAFAFFANNTEYDGSHPFPEDIRNAAVSMISSMKSHWPESVFHTELTVRSSIGEGRYIDARLDLLVETGEGFYIVDHKLSEKMGVSPEETIAKHYDQLALYKDAVEAKGEKPVLGLWIALPQDGMLVEAIAAVE